MHSSRATTVVPLRPLTLGEILDTAIGLLRENARALLPAALALAAAEQCVLYPLRRLAEVSAPAYFPPYSDRVTEFWFMVSTGYGMEIAIIAALGGLAARAAATAVASGTRMPTRALLSASARDALAVGSVALLVGLLGWAGALVLWVPWLVVYGFLGLAVPVVVVDRLGPLRALVRSLVLSARHGLRALFIRLTGYLAWLVIRVGLGFGGLAALGWILPTTQSWLAVLSPLVLTCVNTVAYATLACLDAVLHLETRMRTEGLDIVAVRARGRNQTISLAVSG